MTKRDRKSLETIIQKCDRLATTTKDIKLQEALYDVLTKLEHTKPLELNT